MMSRTWTVWSGALAVFALGALSSLPATADPPVNGPGSTLAQQPLAALPHSPKLPYGLQLMARPDLLPLLRDSKCFQDSSFDRTGGNGDENNFYARNGKTVLLSDIKGPGCIYRFWSANAAGRLHIYFDGETRPTIDCDMQELFLGHVAPFVAPIVGHKSGGWYCYFPMPFQKSCKVEVVDPGAMYYHVQFQRFPDGTKVRTFTTTLNAADQAALKTVLGQWQHIGDPLIQETSAYRDGSNATELAPGGNVQFPLPPGPATLTELHATISPADRTSLRSVVARVYWDGSSAPAIEAPIGDLFGVDFTSARYRASMMAAKDDGFSLYWPMPYRSSGKIVLTNFGEHSVHVSLQTHVSPKEKVSPDAGYFHAQWHRQTTVTGEPFHILQTTGRGQYVGVHIAMQGDRGIGYLEGDEMIYPDGSKSPTIQGTGTEDFFTAGWYFDEGQFNLPYHGCVVKSDDLSRIEAYRLQVVDCVPFQKDIRVDIEHGGENDFPGVDYSCVAYWYQDTPGHTWSPINTAQLTPATYHALGVIEAESLMGAKSDHGLISVQTSADDTVSGAQYLDWRTQGAGDTLDLPIEVTDAGQFGLELGVLGSSSHTLYAATLDGQPIGEFNTSKVMGEQATSVRAAHTVTLSAGTHHLVLKDGADAADLKLDWLLLRKLKYPDSLEAENLTVLEATNGEANEQEMTPFGQDWSGNRQLFFTPSKADSQVTVSLPVEKAGNYKLVMYYTTAPDYGIAQVLMDGMSTGPTTDLFSNDVKALGRRELGDVHLTEGDHHLTIRVVGKNAASRGYFVGIDAIGLEPIP
jgi:hypothetical protein